MSMSIEELYPAMTPEKQQLAKERLDGYLRIIVQIAESIDQTETDA